VKTQEHAASTFRIGAGSVMWAGVQGWWSLIPVGWDKGMEPFLGQPDWRIGKLPFSWSLPIFITEEKIEHRELGKDGPFQGLHGWEVKNQTFF
jgi:hypothetical protein